jgi:hypothetical protein
VDTPNPTNPTSISADPATVKSRNRVAARRRPSGSCGSPHQAMTNHIGINASSKKTKNTSRSSARKTPSDAVVTTRTRTTRAPPMVART